MCQENWGARAQCTEGSTKVIKQSKLRARAPEHMTEASQLHSPTSETDAPCPRGALAPLTASLKGTTTHSRAGNGNSWTSSTPKPSATQIPFPGTFQRWGFNWLVQDPSTRQLSAEWSPDVLALKSLSFNRTLLHSLLWLGAEEGQLGAGGSWASRRLATWQRCTLQSFTIYLNRHLTATLCSLSPSLPLPFASIQPFRVLSSAWGVNLQPTPQSILRLYSCALRSGTV